MLKYEDEHFNESKKYNTKNCTTNVQGIAKKCKIKYIKPKNKILYFLKYLSFTNTNIVV